MRPVRLEIEGFTSFRQKAVLDFSSLDLFAITGPTGSGKTSLIDAIAYALYGRTPRLGDKASELINQGSKRLTVQLEFTAANKQYLLVRTLKSGASATVHLKSGQDAYGKVAEVRHKVEEIVGLDFDGFTKTVVLPQGEFDRFLRGKPEQRRGILRDLLGLGIYEEMGRRAREKAKAAADERKLLQDLLGTTYQDATEATRSALERELADLRDQEQRILCERKRVDTAQPVALDLRQQRYARRAAQLDLESLGKKLAACREDSRRRAAEVEQLAADIHELDTRIAAAGYDEKLHLHLTSVRPLASQREALRQAVTAARQEIRKNINQRRVIEGQQGEQARALGEVTRDLEASTRRHEGLTHRSNDLRKKHGSADAILAAAADLERLDPGQKTRLQEEIAALEKKRKAAQDELAALEKQVKQTEQAWRKATAALEHLQQVHAAGELRRHLKRGKECPVCEQVVRTIPKTSRLTALDEARSLVEERAGAKDAAAAVLAQRQGEIQSLPAQIQAVRRNLRDVESTFGAAQKKAESLLSAPLGRNPVADLRRLAEQVQQLESEFAASAREHQRAKDAEAEARRSAQDLKHRLELTQQQLETLEKDTQMKSVELATLEDRLREWPDVAALQKQIDAQQQAKQRREAFDTQRKRADERCHAAQTALAAAQAQADSCAAQVSAGESAIVKFESSIAALEASLRQMLPDLSLAPNVDEAAAVDSLRSRLERSATDIASRRAVAENRLEILSRQITEAAEKRRRIALLETRGALYEELGHMLRADQFIRFITEQALRRLAAEGTRRLEQLSSGRYSFTTQEDDFFVLDHWNADDLRSVHTLSGGESFLASLSLALALAEGLAEFSTDRESLRLESLFLDEGFSTLDSDTLDVVVQGIETLAGQDRLVGVISHVPELAERLPARVQVHKSPAGSTITIE